MIFNVSEEDKNKSGVYVITNLVNSKQYIGSTKKLKKRFTQHNNLAKKNKHFNKYLQNAINKHGTDNFVFEIIKICDNYLESEQKILDNEIFCFKNHYDIFYNDASNVYSSALGRKVSDETKRKISEIHKGKIISEEIKKKMSDAHLGNKNPMFGRSGKKSPTFGRHHSDETKEKLKKYCGEKASMFGKTGEQSPMFGKTGEKSSTYISPISAKNIKTGDEIITHSVKELARILNVSNGSIQHRLQNNHKQYQKILNKTWYISRIKNDNINT